MKQRVVRAIVIGGGIAVVGLLLSLHEVRLKPHSSSSRGDREDPTASNTTGEHPFGALPQRAGMPGPALPSLASSPHPSQQEPLHRRAEQARARADMAAAKAAAIFAKLAKYGTALDYSPNAVCNAPSGGGLSNGVFPGFR